MFVMYYVYIEIFKAYKILQMTQIDDLYDFIFEDCPSNYFADFALSSSKLLNMSILSQKY